MEGEVEEAGFEPEAQTNFFDMPTVVEVGCPLLLLPRRLVEDCQNVRHICSKFLCPKDLSEFAATTIHRGALSNCPEMKVDLRSLKFPDNSDDFQGSGASIGRSGLLETSLIRSGCSSDLEFWVSRCF